ALATQSDVFAKMISNVKEVRARGAMVVLVTNAANDAETPLEKGICDEHLSTPAIRDEFAPFLAAVYLQLIAYYTSSYRGLDVDQPRNLAKSVTVE
ncbi:MAG: glutamine--fructose-6-phosphate aminotransferase, partial [Lachnospiraceae bacterium]|nr:glutamine--fructose-6-phosphate aminotransferase [Lachnospiraceae bacterium]